MGTETQMGICCCVHHCLRSAALCASDFTQQIENLKDCKFIFMPIYYTPASNFMMQAKGKIADDAIYYGCDGFDGLASAEGFDITTIPQSITMLSHFDSNAKEGKAKEFADKYVAKLSVRTKLSKRL